jgi:hypothetical protein
MDIGYNLILDWKKIVDCLMEFYERDFLIAIRVKK